ncbi:MAG: hypothetical protein IPI60_19835 [Saprospiraceae bacterium]|nr:hypothetical protein [Saprospiraceae bacterium]
MQATQAALDFDNTSYFQDSRFSNSISGTYSRFRNLEKIQAQQLLSFNSSINLNRFKSESPAIQDSASGRFLFIPNYNTEYRNYFVPNKFWGFELDLSSTYDYRYNRNEILNTRSSSNNFNIAVAPTLQFGWGRLEPIDDVFLAKFMVDDMKEAGILNQDLTQEELFALGSTMAFVRNQRIFDFRRLRMYELTEIDKWFSGSGLVGNQDFRYFTVLNDNWLYAYRNVRFAGQRTTIGLSPSASWSYRSPQSSLDMVANLGLSLGVTYELHRPLNQHWQSISTLSAGAAVLCAGCEENSEFFPGPNISLSQEYGWFPNSRTRVSGSAFVSYLTRFSLNFSPTAPEKILSTGINFNADYFVNYQFRILANLGYGYSRQTVDTFFSNDYLIVINGIQGGITFNYTFF